jgi:hypothetical protein
MFCRETPALVLDIWLQGHHRTEVPTEEELKQMLGDAGFEILQSRVSRRRVKAVTRLAEHANDR